MLAQPPLKRPKLNRLIGIVHECKTVGSFINISHLDAAGLDLISTRPFYVRSEWVTLWDKLVKSKQNIFLTGPPGTESK